MAIDVKVFGFLTIPEDATIGVSAHEIGHLREHQNPPPSISTLMVRSIWMA